MKLNDINNVTKQERLEPRKYYSEEQLVELFGIGKKDNGVKQSDVYKVLLNIEKRKSGTHPVRFKDGEVVEVDPELAKRVNNWILQREPSDRKNSERMVSSWEGFQKIAKLLGIEKMLPVAKITDDTDIVRIRELAGLTTEGYYKLPDYDKDKYQKRDGLEGPIPTKSGKVVYYDPQEGMYYDPDTDMFITYDEFRNYDGYETEEVQVNEDEEYNQVKAILDKHNVTSIDDIEYGSDVYEELFGYYMDSGEMPYGVMKARDGMPDEWIADRLYDLGLLEDTHDNLLNRSNRNKDNEILRLSQLAGIVPKDLTMEDYSKMTHDLIIKLINDDMSDEEIQARTGETGKRIKIIRKHVEDDAMDRAQQAYKLARDEQPAEATQDLARSLNPFKSAVDTNVSPQLTAKGLDAITKGDRPTPNQIKAVEPYVSKLAKAISNPQTSAQMRNVFKKVQ